MAARFFINGGVDNNWGTSGNWSLTSGGAGGAGVPTNADDVTFDLNSPNCTINTSARVCKTLTITSGYTKTLTFSQNLTVSGNITLDPAVTFAGSAELRIDTTGTITTNAKTINVIFRFAGIAQTFTLADDLNVSGNLFLGVSTGNTTINSNNINASASVTKATTGSILGTTTLNFTGTGTWSDSTASGSFQIPTVINTAGTTTISGTIRFLGTFTYTAGTVVTTGSTFTLVGASTLTNGSIVWDTFGGWNASGAATVTLNDDINCANLDFTTSSAGSAIVYNGANINVTGGITTAKIDLSGTTVINMIGTGTLAFATAFAHLATFANPFVIDTPSGTITVTGMFSMSDFTYISGNVTGSVNIGSAAGGGGIRSYGWVE